MSKQDLKNKYNRVAFDNSQLQMFVEDVIDGEIVKEGMQNPMTAAGDVIVGGASGAPAKLALGAAGQVLKVNAAGTGLEYGEAGGESIEEIDIATGQNSASTWGQLYVALGEQQVVNKLIKLTWRDPGRTRTNTYRVTFNNVFGTFYDVALKPVYADNAYTYYAKEANLSSILEMSIYSTTISITYVPSIDNLDSNKTYNLQTVHGTMPSWQEASGGTQLYRHSLSDVSWGGPYGGIVFIDTSSTPYTIDNFADAVMDSLIILRMANNNVKQVPIAIETVDMDRTYLKFRQLQSSDYYTETYTSDNFSDTVTAL